MTETPMFASSREALTFAANYKSASIKEPVMYRMLNEMRAANEAAQKEELEAAEEQRPMRINTLQGYTALDRAGQSGYILQMAGRLNESAVNVMLAAVLKPRTLCDCRQPCCQGWRPNGEWTKALRAVDDELYLWIESQKTPGKKGTYTLTAPMRVEILRQFFDRESKVSQELLAERFGVSEATIATHQKKIGKHLTGVVRSAFTQLDDILVAAGIVGALE